MKAAGKYLITGASGFVARHFLDFLSASGGPHEVLGLDINPPRYAFPHAFEKVNLLEYHALDRIVAEYSPEYILHLASFSSVAKSWEKPAECFSNNTNIFLNLLESVRKNGLNSRILSVGSSEEYGIVGEESLPLTEESPLNPVSPYAVARIAQEQLSLIYSKSYGLDIVITRSFNHLGTGQEPFFVIPSIAKQFAAASGGKPVELKVGNISIVRDFLDVRDVVRAYYLLLVGGESGGIYNVCSGVGHTIEDMIGMFGECSGKNFSVEIDPGKVRPNDNQVIIGDYSKLERRTGWKPTIGIKESLLAIYAEYENKGSE